MNLITFLTDNLSQAMVIPTTATPPLLGSYDNPANSCNQISLDGRSSREYWIQTVNMSAPVRVFCNTHSRNCSCNSTGGWARIANLDMTDPNQNCPNGFRLVNRTEPPLRLCGRPGNEITGHVAVTFRTHGIEYTHVCGRVIGYQFNW